MYLSDLIGRALPVGQPWRHTASFKKGKDPRRRAVVGERPELDAAPAGARPPPNAVRLHHWYDVALIALPLLRPLRLLRLLAFLRILNRSAVGSLAGRVTTTTGRVIAIALMVVGIALVGAVAASIAAWFVASLDRDRTATMGEPPVATDERA